MLTEQWIPAAQYLRMSTEHQQYSLQNQAANIREYAERHGFEVTRTYSDPAKSGVLLIHRPGLRQLLQDVAAGTSEYRAILVYDVSRWGRFQDADEAAHYEFLCKSAGIPIHYCAESFKNDGSLPSSIMKALKRAMAGEYSRELGLKVIIGQKWLASQGFKQGGIAGYGFRRLLVSSDRQHVRVLERGQRKSLTTDRVTLVPGPPHEVREVQGIFRKFTVEGMSLKAIARDLNRRGIPSVENKTWVHSAVADLLSHPKYIGCLVFNRSTMRLGTRPKHLPISEWVICAQAHEPIVDTETFISAQQIIATRTVRKTDEQLLEDLRSLLAEKGKLSQDIIDAAPGMPNARTYWYRFGSIRRAAELIGYDWINRRRMSDAEMLDELRSVLSREGVLSKKIIDSTESKRISSDKLKRRFGSLARAYDLVGYDWRQNLTRTRAQNKRS